MKARINELILIFYGSSFMTLLLWPDVFKSAVGIIAFIVILFVLVYFKLKKS